MPVNTASVTYTGGTDGTKTYAECSSRGTCLRTGSSRGDCQCDNDFSASDGTGTGVQGGIDNCEYSTGTSVCPGQVKTGFDCSGHGICDTTTVTALYTCTCTEGWTGHDCGLRTCPEGRAFFSEPTGTDTAHGYAECSNMGICDRTSGECTCDSNFEGAACNRMKCPTGANSGTSSVLCNGKGRCMSNAQRSLSRKVNGVLTPTTYGSEPNTVATWDTDILFSCVCDEE